MSHIQKHTKNTQTMGMGHAMVVYIQVSQVLSISFVQGITTHFEIESYIPTHRKPLFQLSLEIKCSESFPRENSLSHH